jgi:4'-phosphopantetheinyl transferase
VTPTSSAWHAIPSRLRACVGGVDVWAFDVFSRAGASGPEAILSFEERARADRFHFDRDRNRFVQARGALRTLLGAYLNVRPADVVLEYGAHGKPMLGPGYPSPLKFNVSHSGDRALIAIGHDVEVGIDIEAIRPMKGTDEMAARFFSPQETAELRRLPPASFFTCWTRKEAYLKARGDGLRHKLGGFSVSISPGVRPMIIDHIDEREGARWSVHDVPSPGSYAAALVTGGEPSVVRYHDRTAGVFDRVKDG